VLDDRPAGVGQPHTACAALDEPRPGLALERGDLLGDGRLRVGQRLGGGREGAAGRDLAQDPHAADIEHEAQLIGTGCECHLC
jgi:hypothetical protein